MSYFEVSPHEFLLNISDVARYHVSNGNRIIVDPSPGADIDKVHLFLFGSAFGALLYQRCLFPLHGSAIATNIGVMIFVGPQGVGKSTLAAHFQRRGYQLLSDDVCAITYGRGGDLTVLPAFPQIRLCEDAFHRLWNDPQTGNARFDVDKYVISEDSGYKNDPAPLCAVYLLSDNERPQVQVRSMYGFERVKLLLENLYRPAYVQGHDSRRAILTYAADIAAKSVVGEICRKRSVDHVDHLIDFLEVEWRSNPGCTGIATGKRFQKR